jgi:hypothetical protein
MCYLIRKPGADNYASCFHTIASLSRAQRENSRSLTRSRFLPHRSAAGDKIAIVHITAESETIFEQDGFLTLALCFYGNF